MSKACCACRRWAPSRSTTETTSAPSPSSAASRMPTTSRDSCPHISAHDLFDAHLPLIRYEQQQGIGLAVRKYVLRKRGAITYDAQRVPSTPLSATAQAEIDFLLIRLARHDPRAGF